MGFFPLRCEIVRQPAAPLKHNSRVLVGVESPGFRHGEYVNVHGTHTSKTGSVNVQFEKPSKSGKKSASLKKLKIIKTQKRYIVAWKKYKEKGEAG